MTRARLARAGAFVFALLAPCLAQPLAMADRLYLSGGGVIDVASWWIDEGILFYRNAKGTVGLPRSLVVRIEPSAAGSEPDSGEFPPPSAEPAPRPARGAADSAAVDSEAVVRVPIEVAQRLGEARSALEQRDFEAAADLYRSLMDDVDADFHVPRIGYALSQIALGQDDMASAVVLDGLARDPLHPDLLELSGDLSNRQERVAEALRSWRDAFDRSPSDRLRDKILKAERELQAARDYDLSTTSHFNVRYDGTVDQKLADQVMVFLEEAYWSMVETFDHAPRQPITVVLYPTREFRDVTQSAEWVGGIYDGKIRVPLGGLRRFDSVAAGVLAHELTHAFVHSMTRGESPRWLHEGLAQRSEGRSLSRADRRHVLERLQAGDPAQWETAGFSYPMALSLTTYLESLAGFDALVRLLGLLGQGNGTDAALLEVYDESYADLCRSWAASVIEESAP